MDGKPLKGNGQGNEDDATNPKPGDFRLGSPESRAAARALLQTRGHQGLSQYDRDGLVLYCGCTYLDATMHPSYHELEATEVYARGKQLCRAKYGEVIPARANT